ncbi:hypothetical protein BG003_002385 [Podila horticola]|nr:hypothetical protein BG003_002385 [Podila horticola]
MVERHPAVKLEWKVPETIKAAGEFLRGVLVVSAKELPETEMKKVAAKSAFLDQQQYQRGETQKEDRHMKKKLKYDRLIRVEHVEIDLTGIERPAHRRLQVYPRCSFTFRADILDHQCRFDDLFHILFIYCTNQ